MSILHPFSERTAAVGRLSAIVLISLLGLASASHCTASAVSPFSNTTPITINDAPVGGVAKATPYPSVVHVSGIAANTTTKVQVILSTFSHTFPDDVDILLVAPDGTRSIVMSDAGDARARRRAGVLCDLTETPRSTRLTTKDTNTRSQRHETFSRRPGESRDPAPFLRMITTGAICTTTCYERT